MTRSLSDLISVYNAQGRLEGEMIKAFLKSNGIEVYLTQEPAAAVYGIVIGEMGIVEVLVDPDKADEAREVLAAMERGEFMNTDAIDIDPNDEDLPEIEA